MYKIYICTVNLNLQNMIQKLIKTMTAKCKDMGLSAKAIEELAQLGIEGLEENASDEVIEAKADSLVPFAKSMQAEITRKTRKKPQPKPSKKEGEDDDNGGDEVPEWFRKQMETFDTRLQALQDENDALKAEKAKTARATEIATKAKELGIPDYLMKRVSFADDADIDKELADYKQELVNNNLMQKEQTHEPGSREAAMKEEAKSWAESLPNK